MREKQVKQQNLPLVDDGKDGGVRPGRGQKRPKKPATNRKGPAPCPTVLLPIATSQGGVVGHKVANRDEPKTKETGITLKQGEHSGFLGNAVRPQRNLGGFFPQLPETKTKKT